MCTGLRSPPDGHVSDPATPLLIATWSIRCVRADTHTTTIRWQRRRRPQAQLEEALPVLCPTTDPLFPEPAALSADWTSPISAHSRIKAASRRIWSFSPPCQNCAMSLFLWERRESRCAPSKRSLPPEAGIHRREITTLHHCDRPHLRHLISLHTRLVLIIFSPLSPTQKRPRTRPENRTCPIF